MILNCNTNHRKYNRKWITQANITSNRYNKYSDVEIEEDNALIMCGIVCTYLTDDGIDYTFERYSGVWLIGDVSLH